FKSSVFYIQFVSGSRHPSGYYVAFGAVLLSYGIILFKAHGTPQIQRAYLQRILMDENTQYLFLALMWFTSRSIAVALLPYAIFSFFHTLNYLRTDVLQLVFPPGSALHATVAGQVSPFLQSVSQQYQMQSLRAVSYLEVWVVQPYLVLAVLTGRVSFATPLLFAMFLRFRYYFSPLTKEAVAALKARLDAVLDAPGSPLWVKSLYRRAVELIATYGAIETTTAAG
ncbi:hypothetical protein HK405_012335, partial [Cladochytrium tenue]